MEKRECPHCGSALGSGVAICTECGKEVIGEETGAPEQAAEEKRGRNRIYAILSVFLVVIGGVVLLMVTGILPNPLKSSGAVVAIVNGEKIYAAEVNQKLEAYKKIYAQTGKMDFTTEEGKKALDDLRKQILDSLIQERVLLTEAVKAKITVSPQEVAEKIAGIKKGLNLSDSQFEDFLKNHTMSLANFEKRIEREFMINKLIQKLTQEKGVPPEAVVKELNERAKVETVSR
jgi:parvulin-like peptidyl-prolyl isomerase